MKAIILAAGFGTRLLPITSYKHKSLFPIANVPLLDIITENLKKIEIDALGINLHHLPEQLRSYIENKKYFTDVYFSYEPQILNTGGGLAGFKDFIGKDETFIVHNCDILTDIDLQKALDFHNAKNALMTMVLVDHSPKNNVLVDLDSLNIVDIAGFLEKKPKENQIYQCYSCVVIYNSEIFKWFDKQNEAYPIVPVWCQVLRDFPDRVFGYIPDQPYYWNDIGDLKSYFDIHKDIILGKKLKYLNIESDIVVSKTAKIGENCAFEGFCAIGENSVISDNCVLKNCIVWDGVEIKKGSRFENAIITGKDILL